MGQYLMDNNVISYFFSNALSVKGMELVSGVIDAIPNISVITQIEALSWINADKSKEDRLKEFVSASNIISIGPAVVEICVALRRSRRMKTPDAIIAATAISFNYTLLSDDGVFSGIPGLSLINPKLL